MFNNLSKELQEQLKKEGIELLDLPIGDYSEFNSIEDIKGILEITKPQNKPLKTPLCVDYTGRNSIEYYEEENNIPFEGIEYDKIDSDYILNINSQDTKSKAPESQLKALEGQSEALYFDISGKEGYKIPIPSHKDILSNKQIDFKLLYIIASNCERYRENEDSQYIWYITKDTVNDIVKPLYNRHKDTFNKKIKALKDANILKEDTETGDIIYNYDSYNVFVRYDIEKILSLILNEDIKENSYRILTYLLIYCRTEKKSLSYEFIIKNIGLKNINRATVKELLEPLKTYKLINVSQITSPIGINKFITKNYYEVI